MKDYSKDFDGHLILYCKGHYTCKDGFLVGLRRIFDARSGVPTTSNHMDHSVANRLFNICINSSEVTLDQLITNMHRELWTKEVFKNAEGYTALETLVLLYASYIRYRSVKQEDGTILLKLPKPKKRIYNKILKGGDYDYSIYNQMV